MREILEHLKDVCLIMGLFILGFMAFYYFGFYIIVALLGILLYNTFFKKWNAEEDHRRLLVKK